MNNGDFLVAIVFSKILAGNFALLVITTANTENVVHVTFGQLRVGRSRGNLHDALFEVNFRSRDRGTRAEVTSDKSNTLANELVCNSNSLFRIASIITDFENDFFAVNATSSIEVCNRFLGALGHLFAKGGVRAGHRTDGRDNDVCFCCTHREDKRGSSCQKAELGFRHKRSLPVPKVGSVTMTEPSFSDPKPARFFFDYRFWLPVL